MAITKIYKGNIVRDDIVKIYKGNELIYEAVSSETWVINENPTPISNPLLINNVGGKFYYYNGSTIAETFLVQVDLHNTKGNFAFVARNYIPGEPVTVDPVVQSGANIDYNSGNINWMSSVNGYGKYWSSLSSSQKEQLRTVTFETAPTGDLLTWLQANAVKQ